LEAPSKTNKNIKPRLLGGTPGGKKSNRQSQKKTEGSESANTGDSGSREPENEKTEKPQTQKKKKPPKPEKILQGGVRAAVTTFVAQGGNRVTVKRSDQMHKASLQKPGNVK